MAKVSYTLQSFTFPSVSIESLTMNDHGQVEGAGYQVDMGPNYLVTFSEQNGDFVNQGTAFYQNGPPRINDRGEVTSLGGIDNLATGTTTPVIGPDGSIVEIAGENNAGDFVGYYNGQAVIYAHGKITVLNVPGSSGVVPGALPGSGDTSTAPYAINNIGQVLGIYEDSIGTHGFLYSDGSYSTINIPGASSVNPTGINDSGEIVGDYKDAGGNYHGFIDIGGDIQTYDVTGTQTVIADVNNRGQLIGWYGDIANSAGQCMFVATPHG